MFKNIWQNNKLSKDFITVNALLKFFIFNYS